MVLYDVVDFKPTKFSIKKERTHQGYAEAGSPRNDAFSISSIFNSVENVNRENIQNNNKTIKTLTESVSGDELLNAKDLIIVNIEDILLTDDPIKHLISKTVLFNERQNTNLN